MCNVSLQADKVMSRFIVIFPTRNFQSFFLIIRFAWIQDRIYLRVKATE